MVFYSGKLVRELNNPTIVVLTDRNDLDDQLFGTFGRCQDILRQKPVQANSRKELQELLSVSSGGIVFTPIQKADRSTPAVFGKYVDTYDIEQAVDDGATVRIYYESRLAKLELKPEERPKIDIEFEEVTEGEEGEGKEKLKSKWSRVERVAGSPQRIARIAQDIVNHFEERTSVLEGKGIIVCMSRRICFDLLNEIVKLRPDWYDKDDEIGVLKIVMTGSASDPKEWQEHIRNK